MTMQVIQVDAFTNEPFGGNPAAVCPLDAPAPDAWMQRIASEMNLSETAFLRRLDDGRFSLRWFTPEREVDLCGHATLASAHALWELGAIGREEPITFDTRSGELIVRRDGEWIEMDFPTTPPRPLTDDPGFAAALGAEPAQVYDSPLNDGVAEFHDAATVRALRPDSAALRELPFLGVIATAPADERHPGFDFISRFFAPRVGIEEDPVTGSAHCTTGPLWMERLGKDTLNAYQASPRGGVLRLRAGGDRIFISGQAVTTLRGELSPEASARETAG